MMKSKILIVSMIIVLIFTGCSQPVTEEKTGEVRPLIPVAPEVSKIEEEESIPVIVNTLISKIDFNSEEGIREYLIGEWIFDDSYKTQIICNMNIDESLNVSLSFVDSYTNESSGDYTGEIKFDRIYASEDEAPDLISIELIDSDYPGGDFFFLHRTIYNEKRVMSLFFAGNGNSIFDLLGPDGYEYSPTEIVFEKITGEKSGIKPRKDDDFYAVFWGHDEKYESIWLDDVWWTPQEDDDFAALYPNEMTNYEDDVQESVLYNIAADQVLDILGDDMFPGQVYYVVTDKKGDIIEFVSAEYKAYIEGGSITSDIEDSIFDIITDIEEVQEYLDDGMSILFTGDTIMLDYEEYYLVELGTDHEDSFVREIHYAVDTFTQQVYRYDVLFDSWEQVQ